MARARFLVMFMTAARALSAQSSSLPLTTAATRTLLQALSPEIAAPHASLLQAHRNFASYGAFAAVAGAGLYFIMASDAPSARQPVHPPSHENFTLFLASGENAVPAASSDDHFLESDTDPDAKKSASHVDGVLQVLFGHLFPDALRNHFAPKSEIRRLNSLLKMVYKKLKKHEKQAIVKSTSEDPGTINWIIKLKEVLSLPETLQGAYTVLVTVCAPLIEKFWDGTTYIVCPISGLTDVVCVYEPPLEDDGVSVENCEVKKDGSESGTAVLKQVLLVDGGFHYFVTFTRMGWYQNLKAVSLLNYIKNVQEVIKVTCIKDTKVTNIICACEDNSRLVF